MHSFRVRIFLCCVPAIFANGCNPIDPCAEATCEPNEVCVNGACVGCDGAEDCDDQNACTSDGCVDQACSNSPFSCASAADCPAGCNAECLGLDGICFRSFGCESDAECDGGAVCDEDTGTCVECEGDNDCNDNYACTMDYCLGRDCAYGLVQCDSAEDCPAGCNVACILRSCAD